MSMIPIPQETFRATLEAEKRNQLSSRHSVPATTMLAGRVAVLPASPHFKPWAPLLIVFTCFALWGGIYVAFAAAVGWL